MIMQRCDCPPRPSSTFPFFLGAHRAATTPSTPHLASVDGEERAADTAVQPDKVLEPRQVQAGVLQHPAHSAKIVAAQPHPHDLHIAGQFRGEELHDLQVVVGLNRYDVVRTITLPA